MKRGQGFKGKNAIPFYHKLKPSTSVPYKLSKRRESSSSEEGLNLVLCVSSPSALKERCTHPHQHQ